MFCLKILLVVWVACITISSGIALVRDDYKTKTAVYLIFPANLIYIIKCIWKTCKDAIDYE